MLAVVATHLDDNAGCPALVEVTGETGFEPAQHNGIATAEASALGGHHHVDAVRDAVAGELRVVPEAVGDLAAATFFRHIY
ncbi:MAG: hypothetical protein ACXV5Q_08125 [Frankiaceae bacterium]